MRPSRCQQDNRAVISGQYRSEAALLLRVWFEDGDPRQLRIRGIVFGGERGGSAQAMAWTTADGVGEAVRAWLESLVLDQQRRSHPVE